MNMACFKGTAALYFVISFFKVVAESEQFNSFVKLMR